jgi:hypothetical protein
MGTDTPIRHSNLRFYSKLLHPYGTGANMAVLSAYTWYGFPFDNLCLVEGAELDPKYLGADCYLNVEDLGLQFFGVSLQPLFSVKGYFTTIDLPLVEV